MKEIKNISDHNAIIQGDKPILLDFYADWCGPCRALLPIVEDVSEQYKDDFEIVKINVDHNRDLADQYGIRSIPSLFFIQNGEIMEKLTGLQSRKLLNDKIQQYLVTT